MSNDGLHLEKSGGVTIQRQPSPKSILASGHARESLARVVIVGVVLGLLVVCLGCSLVWRPDQAKDVLLVIGSTLGFLLGRELPKKHAE